MMEQTAGLAADGRSLDQLKLEASRNPAGAARAAASQFEALFMQSLLRGLRDTIPKAGLTGSAATDTYTSMLDQQLAQKLAGRTGGLGDVIARQLARHQGAPNPADAAMKGLPAGDGARAGLPVGVPGSSLVAGVTAAGFPVRRVAPGRHPADNGLPRRDVTKADAPPAPSSRPDVLRATDIVRADPQGASPAVRAAAAAALANGQRSDPAAHRQAEFVDAMWPHAVAAQRRTGTPAHLVVAQAALESGWGRRQIRTADGSPSHNLFGIKASRNWTGKTVETVTTEFVDGRPIRMRQRFRAYDSYAEAFADWSRLMNRSPRYEGLTRVRHDPAAYAKQMQAAGYATDPAYADKLERTIRRTLALRRPVI